VWSSKNEDEDMFNLIQPRMKDTNHGRITVLIVDGSAILQERLSALLHERPQLEVVGQTASATEALQLFLDKRPSVVVLDIKLDEGCGLALLRHIKESDPDCRVIVLTNYCEAEFEEECRRQGADFFLHKAAEFEKAADLVCGWSDGVGQGAARAARSQGSGPREAGRFPHPSSLRAGPVVSGAVGIPQTT
jgi:DNA-binding NarL/FixJ family response regulator